MEQIVNAILDDLIQPTGGSKASQIVAAIAATGRLKRGKVKNPSESIRELTHEQATARKEARKQAKRAKRLQGSGMDISEIFKG